MPEGQGQRTGAKERGLGGVGWVVQSTGGMLGPCGRGGGGGGGGGVLGVPEAMEACMAM